MHVSEQVSVLSGCEETALQLNLSKPHVRNARMSAQQNELPDTRVARLLIFRPMPEASSTFPVQPLMTLSPDQKTNMQFELCTISVGLIASSKVHTQ
jgi:hypothetical protein